LKVSSIVQTQLIKESPPHQNLQPAGPPNIEMNNHNRQN